MTATMPTPVEPIYTPPAPETVHASVYTHPATRVEYRDSDHSYRVRNDCTACVATGRVPGAREGKTKQCPKCKGEGYRLDRAPSVSTILEELNKPALVGWAARMAANAVVAELTARTSDGAPALIYPADFDTIHALALNAHRDVKDEAADAGTAVHDWITEAGDVLTEPLPDDPTIRPACIAYREWWRNAGYEVVNAERIVVDERERYAGRFDLLVRDRRGKLYVLDIKTSNSVYLEHVLQCAAYATALRQELGESMAGTIVVWCHKDGRPVRTVERTPRQYRSDFRVFAALLGVYEHRKALGSELRKLAKESALDAEYALPLPA